MTGDIPATTGTLGPSVEPMEQAPAWPPVRHPFQVWTMAAFLTIGAGYFINTPSQALSQVMARPFLQMWSGILIVSGACGLIAALSARSDEGLSLLTERMALVGVGTYTAIYAGALYIDRGLSPWFSEVILLTGAAACTWRYVQVQKRINWNKRVGRDARARWAPPPPSKWMRWRR